jgi:hypothetical protein
LYDPNLPSNKLGVLGVFKEKPSEINGQNNRVPNIISAITSTLKSELCNAASTLYSEIKTRIMAKLNEILSEVENTVAQQLGQIEQIKQKMQEALNLIENTIKQMLSVLADPLGNAKNLFLAMLKPYIPPIFLKVIVFINDLYSVITSAISLVKYFKTSQCANIILKGIGIATMSASFAATVAQLINDGRIIMEEV